MRLPELHSTHITRKQLIRGQSRPVILLSVLHIRRPVPITLAALFAHKRFINGTQRAYMLEGGVLFQQPDGGKSSGARAATEHFLPEEGRMHETDFQEGGGERWKGQHEGGGGAAAVGAGWPVHVG